MKKSPLTFYYLFLLFSFVQAADSGLDLIHADKHYGKSVNGEQLRIFSGSVHFRQDTLDMYCDNATYFEQQERIDFVGNVLVSDGHSVIRAKKIEYYPDTRLSVCIGDVRIKGVDDSLYAQYVSYNFKSKKASAEEDLYILNLKNYTQIWGEKGEYNPEEKYSLVKINARLSRVDSSSGDTLKINAGQLEYFNADSARAVATEDVVIHQGSLTATCDTALYYTDREIAWLFRDPIAIFEDNELSGKKMLVRFDSLKLENIQMFDKAKAVNLADSATQEYNILNGKTIEFQIENKEPKKVIATDNASSIYYLKDDNGDQGSNYATADTIMIFFKEGELDSIAIRGGAEGVFYPENYQGEKVFGN